MQARFLMAVNYTMIGEHSSAKDEYDSLLTYHDIQRVSEINMWSKFNEFALGSNPSLIGLLELRPKTITEVKTNSVHRLVGLNKSQQEKKSRDSVPIN